MKGSVIALFVVAVFAAGGANSRPPAKHRAVHHHRGAQTKPHRGGLEMAARQAPAQRAHRTSVSVRGDETMPTSLEYRFGHSRVVGAVGYNHAPNSYELDPHEVNSAASTQLGHPDDTVGAQVSIPF